MRKIFCQKKKPKTKLSGKTIFRKKFFEREIFVGKNFVRKKNCQKKISSKKFNWKSILSHKFCFVGNRNFFEKIFSQKEIFVGEKIFVGKIFCQDCLRFCTWFCLGLTVNKSMLIITNIQQNSLMSRSNSDDN